MNFGVCRFGASPFGAARFGAGRFGTLGGLTKAVLIDRLKTYGAVSCYLPSEYETTAWQRYDAVGEVRAAVGYSVGFLGDILQGMSLGSELIINGDFSAGTTGWYPYNSEIAVENGRLKITTASGSVGFAYQNPLACAVGDFFVTNSSSINATGVSSCQMQGVTPAYQEAFAILRAVDVQVKYYRRNIGAIGTYSYSDDCTLRRIYGRHLIQPTESSRPTLRYSGGIFYLDPTSGQGLTAYLPASVGSTCTVVYANPGVGAVVVTGVTVTSQAAWLPYKHSGLVIMPSTASAEAVAAVAAMVDVLSRRVVI